MESLCSLTTSMRMVLENLTVHTHHSSEPALPVETLVCSDKRSPAGEQSTRWQCALAVEAGPTSGLTDVVNSPLLPPLCQHLDCKPVGWSKSS